MSLLRSASTVSILTLASRITGLVRELLVATLFGASAMTDAFNVAFRIPNLLRRLFAEGAFSQAFVPILAETRERRGDAATHALVDSVATVLLWVMAAVSLVGVLASPGLIWLMASGLRKGGGFEPAVTMTRLMFPYIGCMSMVALAAGILNTWGRFAVPAVTPVVLNLCVIGAGIGLRPFFAGWGLPPIYSLAVGVMAGGVLQLAIQVPTLHRLGLMPHLGIAAREIRAAWAHDGVRRVLKQMAPAVLGVSVAQLSLLANTQIASHLGVGAVSWLTYADRLMEFPTALLGVALGVVLTPQLSAAQARGDATSYSALLDWGLRLVVLLALPSAVALMVFAQPLVTVLYHYGRFAADDVQQTSTAVMGYGLGLIGLVGVKVLAPGFYAKQDIRTPVKIGIIVLLLTQGMNALFVPWLHVAGLALAIGLGAVVNASWLLIGLRRRGSYQPQPGWMLYLLRVCVATVLIGVALSWAAHHFDWVALRSHVVMRVSLLAACIFAGVVLYFAALMAMGLPLRQMLRR